MTPPGLAGVLLVTLGLFAPALCAQVAPDARWRTLDTPHFRVHFNPATEPLARRAGARAERAYAELSREFVRPPAGRVDLVIADNVDYTNGYATPFPTNRIVVYAHPPVDNLSLAFYDDWLGLILTHELTHIFHLDYARGLPRALRTVFGRSPLLFPNLYVPGWALEGMATYWESRLTGAGRVRGTMHRMGLRTALLEDRFFGIGRASGGPVLWPAGNTAYVYGSLFTQFLAERAGPNAPGEFVERLGGQLIPYVATERAAREAYGEGFGRAWGEWRDSLRADYRRQADSLRAAGLTEPELLTRMGRYAGWPRYSPDGRWVAYAAYTGRDEPETRLVDGAGRVRVLARRNTLGSSAWTAGGALLSGEAEFQDPYRRFSDLVRIGPGGERRRLTHGARLLEPDVGPDGRIVAVRSEAGANALVLVDSADGSVRPLVGAALDVQWSLPRWSPSGDRIAVARWRRGGFRDVVVLDSAGRLLQEVTHDRAVDDAPAWSPDGRYVVFGSDRTGIANLFAWDTREARLWQVTNVLSGAFQPDVAPDGRSVVFALYRADGYHIARIPWNPTNWRPAPPRAAGEPPTVEPAGSVDALARPYSPWPSLRPTTWLPVAASQPELGVGVGAAVAGSDVVGRHAYAAYALTRPASGRTDAALAYRYAGLGRPVLDAVLEQDWSVYATSVRLRDGLLPGAIVERERRAAVGATWTRPRVRSLLWVSGALDVRQRDRRFTEPDSAAARGAALVDLPLDMGVAGAVGHSSVRGYDFSISPEQGWLASFSAQARRYLRPFEGEAEAARYLRLVGQGRAFLPIPAASFARPVVATRLSAGADLGDRSPGRSVGGTSGAASPLPDAANLDLGRDLLFPVRGYPEGTQRGDRAVSTTAEARFPLALVQRGLGTFPLFLDRLWGDVFADAGSAWYAGCSDAPLGSSCRVHPLASVGAELGLDLNAGYGGGLAVRTGVAVPLLGVATGDGEVRPGAQLYLRFGRSF